ncbi:MAG: tripartite tricarboxylate transporter substrate binding protein [Rhodocyclaceae bacterium]|nr:tripartite tricarboxylate transporter substrate binding protein [Rhodocyclaceae bacterium]MCA3089784.1 tripartite tricarboxylate transporter substrate binding protein [Rhodocyclaceae bacterium]MCA3094625.1 tripartite tricarboxylate transporter substrate binding protein [Rhodocyclaceae bacterium]MCA3098273.1 tripartite tricarboxylate transporter substrate binding protein [Rhodocyclaceae bacterium]MCA3100941.1 tripartite tricarboxylate transporter substrate binding protein [Rhodocyclaceae bact
MKADRFAWHAWRGCRERISRFAPVAVAMAWLPAGALPEAVAQQPSWPAKPLRIVVPFAAGGSNDVFARAVAERLPAALGQPVIVENRAGAGSATGTAYAARSAPDGHTLLAVSSTLTTLAAVQPNLPYSVPGDFAPIGLVARSALGLFVHPSLPAKDVQGLVRLARARPGEVNAANAGIGGINHFASEMFQSIAKVKLTHVPYKGNAPALADVMGGHVQMMISSLPPALQHVRSGRLRLLAVSSPERSTFVPELPTLAEAGLPGYAAELWWGLAAPARTPDPVVRRLSQELQRLLADRDLRQRFLDEAAVPSPGSPEAFADLIARDLATWRKVAAEGGIRPE